MIIDDPDDPYADEYDEEYILTISDWYVFWPHILLMKTRLTSS